ncbi:MAG: hypothetical protein WD969_08780 [Paracoccaceae bacterium]
MIFVAFLMGGLTGFLAERFGLVRNGYIVSIVLGVGGAMFAWFAQYFLGLGFGVGRAMTSILGAALMLLLAAMRR